MKRRMFPVWLALSVLAPRTWGDGPAVARARSSHPVVVELFTSEGCSSCPPADRLFASLSGDGVIGLAYHVDYWDDLGWADAYASRQFSDRQDAYVRALKLKQPYTPQMIVNGREEFLGSNRMRAEEAIAAERAIPFSHSIVLTVASSTPEAISVDYRVEGKIGDEHVVIALVQHRAVTDVRRGENANRKLSHANLVRSLTDADLAAASVGTLSLKVPAGVALGDCHVTAFVQSPTSGRITGAVESALGPAGKE